MAVWRRIDRDVQDILGEGLLWSARARTLYWVDILAPALNSLHLDDWTIHRWPMPEPLGWLVERKSGGFIAGFQSGFASLTLEPLCIAPIGNPEPQWPHNRMNDGKADSKGRIWCGTMDKQEARDSGALYRLDKNLHWTMMDKGYRVPNGPAFSPCGQWLYHSDSWRRIIYRYPLRADGSLGARTEFIHFSSKDGYPDGMTTDTQSCLWVAHWGGGCISRFSPQGKMLERMELPARQISNICFAGSDQERMFVTSAATGLEPSAYDGALFEISCTVRGTATHFFDG